MRIAVLHNAVAPGARADEADVLVQVDTVRAALEGAGHEVTPIGCDLDLERIRRRLLALEPAVVFNLVESLGGHDRLLPLVPALCDALAIPYTGSPTEALVLSTGKLSTKRALAAAGLPVPPVLAAFPPLRDAAGAPLRERSWHGPVIVKAVWEHGSPSMDDRAVLRQPFDLTQVLAERAADLGGACFAEPYIEGRELNVAVLERDDGLSVLPPAEIVFEGYPEGKPRIVGYRAKWEPHSFEYRRTPRRFELPASDRPLLAELERLARGAFHACGLHGYGRIDFRVDAAGLPWILEVNANPCLSPDAGLAAASAKAGIPLGELILELVRSAQRTGARGARLEAPASSGNAV